jgi:hypothetical protein
MAGAASKANAIVTMLIAAMMGQSAPADKLNPPE